MADTLWPLVDPTGASDNEQREFFLRLFVECYVKDAQGQEPDIRDWQGKRVKFHTPNFDHAFSEASNYRLSSGIHDVPLSMRRAQRMLWIKEVLAGSAGTIEVRGQHRKDTRGRMRKRRTLIVVEERYVVVLQACEKEGYEFEFVTAFPADQAYLEKIRRESALLEIKKPQSYGD